MGEMKIGFEFFARAAEPVFDNDRNPAFLSKSGVVFKPTIDRHRANDFGNVAVERKAEIVRIDLFSASEGLAGGEFPGFPPEAAPRTNGFPPGSEMVEEGN